MSAFRSLASAVAYFTILPVGGGADEAPGRGTVAWLPVVGAALGAVTGAAGWLAWHLGGSPWSFVVPFVVAIVLTGALHVDGYLDCCDALFASAGAERRREILKDPHHGTFAVAGAMVLGVVWLAALSRFPYALGIWPTVGLFATAACAARFAAVCNIDPARRPVYAPIAAMLLFPAASAGWLLKRWAANRLGGQESGDIYGGIVVALEVAILVAISAYG